MGPYHLVDQSRSNAVVAWSSQPPGRRNVQPFCCVSPRRDQRPRIWVPRAVQDVTHENRRIAPPFGRLPARWFMPTPHLRGSPGTPSALRTHCVCHPTVTVHSRAPKQGTQKDSYGPPATGNRARTPRCGEHRSLTMCRSSICAAGIATPGTFKGVFTPPCSTHFSREAGAIFQPERSRAMLAKDK